ncbi:hypothetical protein [Inhella sp.]|uniref:hypothetical protein n=1 Tax=Inhella sp. TaxID=1921806 RepID=UPI0035AF0A55
MRAVFGVVMMLVVLAVVLVLVKQQTKVLVPAPAPGATAASAAPPAQALPQAVGKQVEGLLQQGAERASEATP